MHAVKESNQHTIPSKNDVTAKTYKTKTHEKIQKYLKIWKNKLTTPICCFETEYTFCKKKKVLYP